MKFSFTAIILSLFLFGCDEQISNITLEVDKLVVEGYLHAGESIDSIRFTKVQAYSSDGTLEPVDDLDVIIDNGIEEFHLLALGNGYYSSPDHIVKENLTYSMTTVFNDEVISAETYVLNQKEVQLSDETIFLEKIESNGGFPTGGFGDILIVDIEWENPENNYYFVDIENIEPSPEFVNEIFQEFSDNLPETFFTSEPEITSVYSINSNRELQYFGTYEITVYRLNIEYAALYGSSNNSTISIQEPPTNVVNGLGIFTAVTPHKLYLEVKEK